MSKNPRSTSQMLLVPFRIPGGGNIVFGPSEREHAFQLGDRTVFIVQYDDSDFSLQTDLSDREEGEALANLLIQGLAWARLESLPIWGRSRAVSTSALSMDTLEAFDLLDGRPPDEDPDYRVVQGTPPLRSSVSMRAGVSAGVSVVRFAESLGVGFTYAQKSPSPARVFTAIALHEASHHERSRTARLMTKVTALESLVVTRKKHQSALSVLDDWASELQRHQAQSDTREESEALDALEREVIFRRDESIMTGLRRTLGDLLSKYPDIDVSDKLKALRTVYNARSKLTHTGRLPDAEVHDATEFAEDLCQLSLRSALQFGLNS